MKVAFVVYPDFTGLDLVGPYDTAAGIDMALRLTERVHGRELAEALQLVIPRTRLRRALTSPRQTALSIDRE